MLKRGENMQNINNKKVLYICSSYYHLLISLIRKMKFNNEADLMLVAVSKNNSINDDNKIIEKLKKSNVFSNVRVVDLSYCSKGLKRYCGFFGQIFDIRKKIKNKEYDLTKYDEIYIFQDYGAIGYLLSKQKIRYNLLEDGTDCYKNKYSDILKKRQKKSLIKYIKRLFNFYDRGQSKFIKSIEVNDATDLFLKHDNVVELPKDELFESVKDEERKVILNIFLENDESLKEKEIDLLLLTQPLDIDGFVECEEQKIDVYKRIISDFSECGKIIIKPHPREELDYSKVFSNNNLVEVINKNFPIEIINFLNIGIKRVVTIKSTAINNIKNCNEKIELGLEYIKKDDLNNDK
jgi:hypothetical protein